MESYAFAPEPVVCQTRDSHLLKFKNPAIHRDSSD